MKVTIDIDKERSSLIIKHMKQDMDYLQKLTEAARDSILEYQRQWESLNVAVESIQTAMDAEEANAEEANATAEDEDEHEDEDEEHEHVVPEEEDNCKYPAKKKSFNKKQVERKEKNIKFVRENMNNMSIHALAVHCGVSDASIYNYIAEIGGTK